MVNTIEVGVKELAHTIGTNVLPYKNKILHKLFPLKRRSKRIKNKKKNKTLPRQSLISEVLQRQFDDDTDLSLTKDSYESTTTLDEIRRVRYNNRRNRYFIRGDPDDPAIDEKYEVQINYNQILLYH